MVRPGRNGDKLCGDIEADESYVGGPSPAASAAAAPWAR
jgi:hypothetical protein